MERLWIYDPSVLFSSSTWQKFVPTKDMDVPTALNSVVRFTTYFSIILFLSTGHQRYIIAIPIVLLLTVLFSKLFPTTRDIESFSQKVIEQTEKYTRPTGKNPFMNPLLTEILDNPNRADSAPITSKTVQKELDKAFQHTSDIYMNTTDLFDQSQAMRTFHTLQAGVIPNDQDGFLNFLAKGLDEPDISSAFPARNAKIKSEGYVEAIGSMKSLPNTTARPAGTTPSMQAS
jgi:hypothetical protein